MSTSIDVSRIDHELRRFGTLKSQHNFSSDEEQQETLGTIDDLMHRLQGYLPLTDLPGELRGRIEDALRGSSDHQTNYPYGSMPGVDHEPL